MKNPLTSARIEPATFRFVAQHLNHCATADPNYYEYNIKKVVTEKLVQSVFISMLCMHVCVCVCMCVCMCVCVCVCVYTYIYIYIYI